MQYKKIAFSLRWNDVSNCHQLFWGDNITHQRMVINHISIFKRS